MYIVKKNSKMRIFFENQQKNSQMNKNLDNSDRIKRSIIISKRKIMLPTVDILGF